MATFTMYVKDTPAKNYSPYKISDVITPEGGNCERTLTVRVPVPPSGSRYVVIAGSGSRYATSQDYANTISTQTDFAVTLTGLVSETESLNTDFSIATIKVALSSGSGFFETFVINRQSTPEPC